MTGEGREGEGQREGGCLTLSRSFDNELVLCLWQYTIITVLLKLLLFYFRAIATGHSLLVLPCQPL